jgi:alpha-N-arabinofuranosidase
MNRLRFALVLLVAGTAASSLLAQTASLNIQVDHPTAKVSPMLYGLMTEEINFSYDIGYDYGSERRAAAGHQAERDEG